MLNRYSTFIISIFTSTLLIFSHVNAEVKVVASIKPIHSLVSYVMDGVGKPSIIVDGSNSPHNFNLKPSNAKAIENADIIFWVGEDIESFLEKPLKSISKKAKVIEMMDIKGIKKLKFRERNIFEEHEGHDDHGHEKKKSMTIMDMVKRRSTMIMDMVKRRSTMITDMGTHTENMILIFG